MINKIFISYFYQIRNFSSNMIPISTAKSQPKWFTYHIDKNGVINGFQIKHLAPGRSCMGLCKGRKECNLDPDSCDFIRLYREQLYSLDFDTVISYIENIISYSSEVLSKSKDELIPVLIVYETPDNKCSERGPLIEWFKSRNIELQEWVKND